MQNTVINRSNKEIERLEQEYESGSRERDALVKKGKELNDEITRVQTYIVDNQSNFTRLERIVSKITELQLAFGTDGDSSTVTATDISKFESLRDELAEQVDNLYLVTHPDVVDPYAIIHLKQQLSSIQGLSPAVGADTDAVNQEITDYLSSLSDQTTNAMDVTRSTISMASKLSLRYQASGAGVQEALDTKGTLALQELNANIENVKINASNVLQAISLTYDAQSYTTNYLSNTLTVGIETPSNSILNIFT